MRYLSLIMVLTATISVNSQQISDTDLQKLEDMHLSTANFDLKDITVQKNLNQILLLDKKRKTNKTLGIVFGSAAIASLAAGSILLSKEHPTADVVGGIMLTGGLMYGGVSIPFWIASKKRKKERGKLLELYE